jgi:hypothetical protein
MELEGVGRFSAEQLAQARHSYEQMPKLQPVDVRR